jgi:hypothetical protein
VFLDALILTDPFGGPPGYQGIPGTNGSNHLFLMEAPARVVASDEFLGCDQPIPSGSVFLPTLHASARWTTCPAGSGMNSGHILLTWTTGGALDVISLHSDTATNRSIALAVADHLIVVNG